MTANREVSEQLRDVSGWVDTPYWFTDGGVALRDGQRDERYLCPAYDSTYLLGKLPDTHSCGVEHREGHEVAYWRHLTVVGETPASALARLSLRLFADGILTR